VDAAPPSARHSGQSRRLSLAAASVRIFAQRTRAGADGGRWDGGRGCMTAAALARQAPNGPVGNDVAANRQACRTAGLPLRPADGTTCWPGNETKRDKTSERESGAQTSRQITTTTQSSAPWLGRFCEQRACWGMPIDLAAISAPNVIGFASEPPPRQTSCRAARHKQR
jgi:hypothetical protein